MQRILDIFFSGLALLLLSPLLLPIALMLRLTGEGEIFFLQERVGRDGRLFKVYKFATMLKNSPNIGAGTVTVKDDPRVLPLGRLLRKTKINELPQLINIFIGDMSLVGPRPLALNNFVAYPEYVKDIIVSVRPGLSGFGSILFRNEEDVLSLSKDPVEFYDKVILPYKGKVEVWYVRNRALSIYFSVIFMTLWVVFLHDTKILWRAYPELPPPPDELKSCLQYYR